MILDFCLLPFSPSRFSPSRFSTSHILENHRRPLPYSNAHRRQTIPYFSFHHFMYKGCADAHAAATQWVTQCDSTSVDIDNPRIQPKISDAGKGLGCKGLI